MSLFRLLLYSSMLLIACQTKLFAQPPDSLYFQHIKGRREIGIPLSAYPVRCKWKNGRKEDLIMRKHENGKLVVSIYSNRAGEERKQKQATIQAMYMDSTLNSLAIDSLICETMYSLQDTIVLSDLDKIVIHNDNRAQKRSLRRCKNGLALGIVFIGVPAAVLFRHMAIYTGLAVATLGYTIFEIMTDRTRIRLSKWKVADTR